jgi:chemotaxis protein MotA
MGLYAPVVSLPEAIEKIVNWSNIARKEGLLRLEDYIQQEPDPFASKALQLLVDGKEPEEIRHILEMDMTIHEESELQAISFFRSASAATRPPSASSARCWA